MSGFRICRSCTRSLRTREFSGAQLTRYPNEPRCRDCVAGLYQRDDDDDDEEEEDEQEEEEEREQERDDDDDGEIVSQCQVCTMVKSTTELVESTVSQLHLCFDCSEHNDWCSVCEALLDEEFFSHERWRQQSHERVCIECEPLAIDRTNLTECDVCHMRLGRSDFDGSGRTCRTCSRASSNAASSNAASAASRAGKSGGDRSEHLCIICIQNERDATWQCWHLAVCVACAAKLDGCPICRSTCDYIPLNRV